MLVNIVLNHTTFVNPGHVNSHYCKALSIHSIWSLSIELLLDRGADTSSRSTEQLSRHNGRFHWFHEWQRMWQWHSFEASRGTMLPASWKRITILYFREDQKLFCVFTEKVRSLDPHRGREGAPHMFVGRKEGSFWGRRQIPFRKNLWNPEKSTTTVL